MAGGDGWAWVFENVGKEKKIYLNSRLAPSKAIKSFHGRQREAAGRKSPSVGD